MSNPMTTPQQSSPPAPQAVKELVERLRHAAKQLEGWDVEKPFREAAEALASLQEDRDRLERLYRERTELAEAQRRRAEQAERERDEWRCLAKDRGEVLSDAIRAMKDANTRAQQAERDLAAERERVRELEAALRGWNEAYPERGKGNSIEDLWARYGSEFAYAMKLTRAALSRPASTESRA
jgi:hypothetical protein